MSYNNPMKVWRGFTLTVWVILLTLLATYAMQYRALQTTALDKEVAKVHLQRSGAYETFRDTVLLDKLRSIVQEQFPKNTLVDDAMLRAVLAETLPKAEMERRFEPAVDAFYGWIDSKEPEISFSIDLSDRVGVFYRVLEVQLAKKLTSLPSCGDYRYPPEDAVLVDKCIPVYISVAEVTSTVMGSLETSELPFGNTITHETFASSQSQTIVPKQTPTYLNYLWVLNYIALALFILISLLLVISRKSLGLIAIGISLIAAGSMVWITQPILSRLVPSQTEGMFRLISDTAGTLLGAFSATGTRYALISIGVGAVLVAAATTWRWWKRNRRA